ncbi:MAG TPA: hypothetical protein VFV28_10590 [Limnobacter sp.]|nr:hypothetical protein [Limnobacter sp.]
MNKNSLKLMIASSMLACSASAMAVGLGAKTDLGVNAQVPGLSVNAGASADANAQSNADVKGKSSAAVKGAKSKGDEMRSEAGALHSEAKGEVGKRTGQLDTATNLNASADVKADAKAKGKVKGEKK